MYSTLGGWVVLDAPTILKPPRSPLPHPLFASFIPSAINKTCYEMRDAEDKPGLARAAGCSVEVQLLSDKHSFLVSYIF